MDLSDWDYCPTEEGPSPFKLLEAIGKVMDRPWFGRTWIVQEFVLGSKDNIIFQIGQYQLSIREFDALFNYRQKWALARGFKRRKLHVTAKEFLVVLRWSELRSSQIMQSIVDFEYATKGKKADFTRLWSKLLYWLTTIRRTVATDSRDKIFAAFGLAGVYCQSGVQELRELVDYNICVQEVYANLVKTMITATKRLDILLACSARGEQIHYSWTPDWTLRDTTIEGLLASGQSLNRIRSQGKFSASRDTDAVVTFSSDMKVLSVRGFVWNVVAWEWEEWNGTVDENREVVAMVSVDLMYRAMKKHEFYTTREEREEALKKIILPDAGGDIREELDPEDQSNDSEDGNTDKSKRKVVYEKFVKPSRAYLIPRLANVMWRSTFFLTEKGYLVKDFSKTVKKGDLVCILLGCPVPVTLRRHVDNGEVWYEFGRGVYVEGIMHGRAMDMEGLEMMDFALR